MLNREIIQNQDEKEFVTSLIMSDKCCQVLIPYIKLNYFDIDYTRTVVSWVMDYYKKFRNSPKQDIISVYRSRCDEIQDDALKELILNYIQELGKNEIAINNEDYLVDKCKDFIEYKAMEIYTEEIQSCLDTKNMDKARQIQSEYRKVSTVNTNEVDIMDPDSIATIVDDLNEVDEELFTLPDVLTDVIGKIHRNDFIAILAPPKKGKTWILQYLGILAMKQHLNVTIVSMEMTRAETVQRLWKSLFGVKSGTVRPGRYETAKFVEDCNEQGKFRAEPFDFVVKEDAGKDVSSLQKELRRNNQYQGHLEVIAYPAFGESVIGITNKIEEMAENGFVTDVLIIDYADITKPIGGSSEVRHQLDAIWKHLRGFASRFHCAVITASQTNRSGLSSSVIGGEAIGEDFRKLAHITSMVSLEQTPKMRKNHVMRIRNIALRKGESKDEPCMFCQCLPLGQFVFGEVIPASDYISVDDDDEEDTDE